MKIIKQILIDGQGWIYSEDGEIRRFGADNGTAFIEWFRQGNKEYNGKYVIIVEFKDDNERQEDENKE